MMWQSAGRCGLDSWSFVIDPVSSAKSSDPLGKYTKTWLPIVKLLPKEYVHKPWSAPNFFLQRAGIRLGDNYPHRLKIDSRNTQKEIHEMMIKAGPSFRSDRGYDMIELPDKTRTIVF